MSRKQGCSVQIRGEQWAAASVTPGKGPGWHVDQLAHGPVSAPPPADLRRTWQRAGDHSVWLIPDTEARSTTLAVPRLKGAALQRAVEGLVARDEGGEPGQWQAGWQPVAGAGDSHELFTVFAQRDQVAAHLATAEAWGRKPGAMAPVHVVCERFYREFGPERDEHEAWNLVFVGAHERFLCVSTRSGPLLTRDLPADLSEGREPTEYMDRLATEVERSIFFAKQTEHSPQIARVIIIAEAALAEGLVQRLEAQDLAPALHWDLEGSFSWGERTVGVDDLPVLMAAALAPCRPEPNLLPRARGGPFGPRARRRTLVAAGALAAAAVPVLLVGGVLTARSQNEYLRRARNDVRAAESRAGEAERLYRTQRVLMARENLINRFATEKPDLESLLRRLAAVTPPQVVFRDLRIREDDEGRFTLVLSGESLAARGADAQAAFLEFLENLRTADFLESVDEPRQLRIKPWDEDDAAVGQRTLFSLDLRLATTQPAQEG